MAQQRNMRTVWTEDERELLAVRARQIRRDNPDIGFKKLFALAQDVLPGDRRRSWHNREGDSWLIEASRAPSAVVCAAFLEVHLEAMRASSEAVARTLGAFLRIPEPAMRELLSYSTRSQLVDEPNDSEEKNIGREIPPSEDRQFTQRSRATHADLLPLDGGSP